MRMEVMASLRGNLLPSAAPTTPPLSPIGSKKRSRHPDGKSRIRFMSQQPGFFQRRPLRRALANWLERHQHPFNRGIHFLGIPLALAGVVLIFWLPWEEWYWG